MVLYFLLDLPTGDGPEGPHGLLDDLLPRLEAAWPLLDLVQVRAKGSPASLYVEALGRVMAAGRRAAGDLPRLRRGARGLEPAGAPVWAGEGDIPRRPLVLGNDRVDVALAADADGVHLGSEDLPPEAARALGTSGSLVIGLTCHGPAQLGEATRRPVDYVGLGTFFPSPTKPGVAPDARAALGETEPRPGPPLYAIGGLTLERLPEVLAEPRVAGVVVSSAIQRAADPTAAVRAWRVALDRATSGPLP